MRSRAYPKLSPLQPGDAVPADLYVKDYADGTRPDWRVAYRHEPGAGVIRLTLVDVAQREQRELVPGPPRIGDVAVTVLTWPAKTMRSQVHLLGRAPTPELCDMDQQARADVKRREVACG